VLFPLFSNTAINYEEYICHFLEFRVATEAYTSVATTASAGKVIMSTNFDINDPLFTSDTQMENYQGMRKAPPFRSFKHDVIHAHKKRKGSNLSLNNYFVYSSANSSGPNGNGADKFYDMGLFQLATQNNAVTTEIGELYVTYEFTMIRPKQQAAGADLLVAHLVESPAASATAAAPLGTGGGTLRSGSTIPVVSTNTTFSLPIAGTYSVSFAFKSTTLASNINTSNGANITALNILADNSTSSISAFIGGTASVAVEILVVTANGSGAANLVTISGLNSAATGSMDIIISEVPSTLLLMYKKRAQELLEEKQESRLNRIEKYFRKLNIDIDGMDSDDEEEKCVDWSVNNPVVRQVLDHSAAVVLGGTPKIKHKVSTSPGWFSTQTTKSC